MANQAKTNIGVISDDLTGATDIGCMFARAGHETHVHTLAAPDGNDAPDVLVIDTDSRLDTAVEAYEKVFAATRRLRDLGAARFWKKSCSVFRGNVGVEFDAMLDALGEEFAIVVAAYPMNQRAMVHGIQYVAGTPLAESHFRNDPTHPTTDSNLVAVLQRQTRRRVSIIDAETVALGLEALRERIAKGRDAGGYLMFDVPDQAALRVIAEATRDERVFAGSAGLAEDMGLLWRAAHEARSEPALLRGNASVLCTVGSLTPQTAAQVVYARERGLTSHALNSSLLFSDVEREAEIERLVATLTTSLMTGCDALFVVTGNKANQREPAGSARTISHAVGNVVARAAEACNVCRFVVAGGDTSAAVCAALGVTRMRIGRELETGIPLCSSLDDPARALVLKPGSMGQTDILARAVAALKSL